MTSASLAELLNPYIGWAVLAGLALGLIAGVVATVAWYQMRHDCMPHEAKDCRREGTKP